MKSINELVECIHKSSKSTVGGPAGFRSTSRTAIVLHVSLGWTLVQYCYDT